MFDRAAIVIRRHSTRCATEHLSNGLDDILCAHIPIRLLFPFQTTSYEATKFRDRLRNSYTRTQCCVKSDILAGSIICRGRDDNALRKKSILFVPRPYVSFADEQKSDSTRIFTCTFACVSRRMQRENAAIYFLTCHRQKVFDRHSRCDHHRIELYNR